MNQGQGIPNNNFPQQNFGFPQQGQQGGQNFAPQPQGNFMPPQYNNQMNFPPQGMNNMIPPQIPQMQGSNPNFMPPQIPQMNMQSQNYGNNGGFMPPQQGNPAFMPPMVPQNAGFMPPNPNMPPQGYANPYGNQGGNNMMPPQMAQTAKYVQPGQQFPVMSLQQQNLERIYINKTWYIGNPQMKGQYEQKRKEFQERIVKNQPMPSHIQFQLTDTSSIWIKKSDLLDYSQLSLFSESFDLKEIYSITESYKGVLDALFYCFYPYIELEEQKQMTQFLLACWILKIQSPFESLSNYLQNPQNIDQNAHKLKNTEEILEIYIYLDQKNILLSNDNHPMQQYLNLLLSKNPNYFMNEANEFNKKIKHLSYQAFIGKILAHVGDVLLPQLQPGQFVSLAQVETISGLIHFYFTENTDVYDDPLEYAQKVFSSYYKENILKRLSEIDQIQVMKLLPFDSNIMIEKLVSQYQQQQKLKVREKALVRILLAQRAQNISLESYKDQFTNSIKIATGDELDKDIDQLIQDEIQNIYNQQQNQNYQ